MSGHPEIGPDEMDVWVGCCDGGELEEATDVAFQVRSDCVCDGECPWRGSGGVEKVYYFEGGYGLLTSWGVRGSVWVGVEEMGIGSNVCEDYGSVIWGC